MEFAAYVEARLGKVKPPSREIEGRWVGRIEKMGWDKLQPAACVRSYLDTYGKGIGAAKLVDLARCAEFKQRHDIALAFLEVAYRMEFPDAPPVAPVLAPVVVKPTVEVVIPPDQQPLWQAMQAQTREAFGPAQPGLLPSDTGQMSFFTSDPVEALEILMRPGRQDNVVFVTAAELADMWPFPVQPGWLATMQPVDFPGEMDPDELRQALIEDSRYWAQPKRDGKRCVVFASDDRVVYQSRCKPDEKGALWSAPAAEMDEAFRKVARQWGPYILDGELTWLAADGSEHRTAPQAITHNGEIGQPSAPVCPTYCVFKALYLDYDLRGQLEWERIRCGELIGRELVDLDPAHFQVVFTARNRADKAYLCATQQEQGREGEVWILQDVAHLPGKNLGNLRRGTWPPMIRTKYLKDWTLRVNGLSASGATKVVRLFSAVQVVRDMPDGSTVSMGSVGTGFTMDEQREIKARFESGQPLYIEVTSQGLTESGQLWHPRFVRITSASPE